MLLYGVSLAVIAGAAAVIWVLVRNSKKHKKDDAVGSGHGG